MFLQDEVQEGLSLLAGLELDVVTEGGCLAVSPETSEPATQVLVDE